MKLQCNLVELHVELFILNPLYGASHILSFSQIEVLWQPCVEKVYWHHFSKGICSLPVCQSFGNSHKISNFFIIICHSDLWCYYCNWGEYKMVHLMCVFCLLHRLAIHPSLFLSWSLSILWDTTILKLGQLITLQWLPHIPVKGRINQSSKLECWLILINCHSHPNL